MMAAEPENTVLKQKKRPAHLFKPGQSGNPAGRPLGARQRLANDFIGMLAADWNENGVEAIRKLRATDVASYVKAVASLVPKEIDLAGADGGPVRLVIGWERAE